jgi:two-component system NtrC family sensor kinase
VIRLRKVRPGTATLAALAVLLSAAAVGNVVDRSQPARPDDGVVWVDSQRGVEAARVDPQGPAASVGVRPGDLLRQINGSRIERSRDVDRLLGALGAWSQADYRVRRNGADLDYLLVTQTESSQRRTASVFQWTLGLVYLLIGAFVWRRSPQTTLVRLFFLFSLSSFVLYCFSYTGELGGFDRFIYWADVWATLLTPALFLHFAAGFPLGLKSHRSRLVAAAGYGVAAALIAVRHVTAAGLLQTDSPVWVLQELLDKIDYGALGLGYMAAALALRFGGHEAEDLLIRTQRRWLSLGALAGTAPFVAFYVAPFVAGRIPGPNHTLSIFPLALIPISFAFAIARQRFMDVELYVRRGAAYTLATAAVLAAFYGGAFGLRGWFGSGATTLAPAAWVASVVIAALLYNPLRRYIQGLLDRHYYRERYDYRRTLADFASELSAETNTESMLESLGDRLARTLGVGRVAIFTCGEDGESPRTAYARGFEAAAGLNLRFLTDELVEGLRYRAFGDPSDGPLLSSSQNEAIAELNLYYYVPCRVQGRTIAWIGLGLTEAGQYLTTEDLSLVEAVSGNFAIALENARLYRSLEKRSAEYQRLKDFNENIVESLHVGIMAVDLSDRVESWNTQLELLFGISREDAIGRKLHDLLPATLVAEFESAKSDSGVRSVYKLAVSPDDFPEPHRPSAGHASTPHILNAAIAPLVAKNFEPIGRLVIVDDVTDRVELEEQVLQADKLSSIGLLAAGVAHEVNTPLAVISSYAQMLAKQVSGDPGHERILEKITKQTFRASEIVNSLLSFSRTASNDFAPVSLTETLEETLSLTAPQLRKAAVRVETDFEPGLPEVRGASNKLQQVFLNLILNARDAMPEGGVLRVEAKRTSNGSDGPNVLIVVSDTGVGIPQEKLGKIFDPFFTTKAATGGTGLGLAVSYGIIQEHGGTLSAENSPSGRGARFTIELPVVSKPIHA